MPRYSQDELALRSWIRDMRTQPHPPAKKLGLAAMGPIDVPAAEELDESEPDDLEVEIEVAVVEAEVGDPQAACDPATEVEDDESPRRRVGERLGKRLSPFDGSSSAKIRAQARLGRKPAPTRLRELGLADFVGGNLVKWGALMSESKEELGGTCQGANWLYEYQQLHEEVRVLCAVFVATLTLALRRCVPASVPPSSSRTIGRSSSIARALF